MAIAVVQQTNGGGGAVKEVTISGTAAGNLLIVFTNVASSTEEPKPESIGVPGGEWHLIEKVLGNTSAGAVWAFWQETQSGQTTIKVTPKAGTVQNVCVMEISGGGTSLTVEALKANPNEAAAKSESNAFTTTNAGDLVLGYLGPCAAAGFGAVEEQAPFKLFSNSTAETLRGLAGYVLPGETLSGTSYTLKWATNRARAGLWFAVKPGGAKNNVAELTASLSFAGAIAKQTEAELFGGLSFGGSLAKKTEAGLFAGLSFAGSVAKQTAHGMAAGLSFAGSVAKQTAKGLVAAGLSFKGGLEGLKIHVNHWVQELTGTLSFGGSLTKQTGKGLSGALSSAGSLARVTGKGLTASLPFKGGLNKGVSRPVSATLSFSGSLSKKTSKALAAAVLSFKGLLEAGKVTSRLFVAELTSTLSFQGSLNKKVGKALGGALSFLGGLVPRRGQKVDRVLETSEGFTPILEASEINPILETPDPEHRILETD